MDNLAHLGLSSYLNSQLTSAWDMAADSSSYAETPNEYLCRTINVSLKTNPQTKIELDQFVQEGMRQLLSNSTLLRENGVLVENDSSLRNDIVNMTGKGLSAAGFYSGYRQYDLYIDAKWNDGVGKWKGRNGVWYMENVEGKRPFWGNQYTGTRKNIIAEYNKYSKLGTRLFGVSTVLSFAQGGIALYEGDTAGVIKAGADITIGFIAACGGPVGWTIGGVYLFLDLIGTFDPPQYRTSSQSPYSNNPHVQLRDKTYVKPPVILPYPRQRIPIPPKPIPVFRQGYKKY